MPVYLVMTALATGLAFWACMAARRLPAGMRGKPIAALKAADTRKAALQVWALAVGSALPYVLVSGFRYKVGTDYIETYEPLIQGMLEGVEFPTMIVEPGYWAVCRILSGLGLGITWLMLFSAAFTIAFFWVAFYDLSDIPWLSVFLFAGARPFFISMNCVRQYMAMAMALFAFRYIKEKCFWKYALCICVAALWHSSILVFLPLYFLRYVKPNPFAGAGLLALTVVFKEQIMALLRFVVEKTPYAFYIGSIFDSVPPTYPEKFLATLPVFVVGCVYYFVADNRKDALFRVLLTCQLGVLFFALNRNVIPLAERVSWMLEMTQLLFIPMLLHREPRKWLRWVLGAVMIGALLWFTYYEIFQHGYQAVNLYRCVFFPDIAFQ